MSGAREFTPADFAISIEVDDEVGLRRVRRLLGNVDFDVGLR
jgi:hypothetical protein